MRFALMMYDNVREFQEADDDAKAGIGAQHEAFMRRLKARGQWAGGLGWQATTVRKSGGAVEVSDGPHSEAIDQIGGFYLVEVDDIESAIELARDVPAPTVEIRPIAE
jgi:hypothetical protein